MIFPCHPFTNCRFHQTGQRWEHVDWRIDLIGFNFNSNDISYLSILQLSININLAFSNITSQIRNRMSNIFIWHSENWNLKHHMLLPYAQKSSDRLRTTYLCNGSGTPFYTAGTFINCCQIGIHITRKTTTTGYL